MNSNVQQKNKIAVINHFRKLWEQKIIWTRCYMMSAVSGSNDLPFVSKRLLRNSNDFAQQFGNFYGQNKVQKLEQLLNDDLLISTKIIMDLRCRYKNTFSQDSKLWYINAKLISQYLSEINPFWNSSQWLALWQEQLKLIQTITEQRINSQFTAEIASCEKLETHVLQMADMMAFGIIKQFRIYQ